MAALENNSERLVMAELRQLDDYPANIVQGTSESRYSTACNAVITQCAGQPCIEHWDIQPITARGMTLDRNKNAGCP
jgi:hypothetical protein